MSRYASGVVESRECVVVSRHSTRQEAEDAAQRYANEAPLSKGWASEADGTGRVYKVARSGDTPDWEAQWNRWRFSP